MDHQNNTPMWYLFVAILAAAWNGLGVVAYISEAIQTPKQLAHLSETHQALYASKPTWATAAFAISVFSGLLGSFALIAKKRLATSLFSLSLIGLIIQNTYYFLIAKVQNAMESNSFIMPLIVFFIAIVLLLFSRSCVKKTGSANALYIHSIPHNQS